MSKKKMALIVFVYALGSSVVPVLGVASAVITIGPTILWAKTESCENGYTLYLLFIVILLPSILYFYSKNIGWFQMDEKRAKIGLHAVMFMSYSMSNYIVLHLVLGTHNMCHGDGQSALAILPAGLFSTLFVVPFVCIMHNNYMKKLSQ